ncbi:MAG: PQQ-binding-like beta-propeller repeat protein, partial [Cryomorphaceae bacterium]
MKFQSARSIQFAAVLLAGLNVPAQGHAQEVFRQDILVGTDRLAGRDLYATVLNFPDKVGHVYPDLENGLIQAVSEFDDADAFGLSSKGDLWVYDLKADKMRWSSKIRFANNAVYGIEGVFVENPGNKAFGYDAATGKRQWKAYHDIYFLDGPSRIAVGYETRGAYGSKNMLSGIDMDTGETLWYRKIQKELGWNELLQLSDSVYLVMAAGLHSVNIFNGGGWSYKTRTGERNRPSKGLGLGRGLGVFKGDMVSNLIYDTTDVYFASKERIVRLSAADGKPVWISEYPDDIAGNSIIFTGDSLIHMVNRGMAMTPYGPVKHGLPFLAAYRKDSGHPVYFTGTKDSEVPVLSYDRRNGHILLLTPDYIEKRSLSSGGLLRSENFEDEDYGSPLQFLDTRSLYSKTLDGKYETLHQQSP